MKHIRIINKYKFIRSITILLCLISIAICVANHKTYSNSETKYKTEYVVKGETLWEFAEEEIQKNAYFQDEDIQNVILELKEINHMTTSNLSEGMEIKIPVY